MKSLYTIGKWKINKRDGIYYVYEGRKQIDNSESFNEAYALLHKHKKNIT